MSLNENIHSVKERDGQRTEYQYERLGDEGRRIVETSFDTAGAQLDQKSYHYEMGFSAEGVVYRKRFRWTEKEGGGDVLYDPISKKPLRAHFGNRDLQYEMDVRGRIKTTQEGDRLWTRQYDPQTGALINVTQTDLEADKLLASVEIGYDAEHRPNLLRDETGRELRLTYTRFGDFDTFEETGSPRLQLEWNRGGRLLKLRVEPAAGTVAEAAVGYDASGQPRKMVATPEVQVVRTATEFLLRVAGLAHRADLPPYTGCQNSGCEDPNCSRAILSQGFYDLAGRLASLGEGPAFEDLRKRAEVPKD